MIRFFLRFVGLFILAGGFIAVLYDGTKSIAGNQLVITPFGDVWRQIHPETLAAVQGSMERYAPAWAWDPAFVTLLMAPTALVLTIVGAALMLLGRRKKQPVRYGFDP
jgi:hypothetical protein